MGARTTHNCHPVALPFGLHGWLINPSTLTPLLCLCCPDTHSPTPSICTHAVGFVSRPVGALLFGHMGDTRGRGLCLLLSVILMGVPTVVIGCLPTYSQAGIAAPALLAIARLIQGLAMGGEFGELGLCLLSSKEWG